MNNHINLESLQDVDACVPSMLCFSEVLGDEASLDMCNLSANNIAELILTDLRHYHNSADEYFNFTHKTGVYVLEGVDFSHKDLSKWVSSTQLTFKNCDFRGAGFRMANLVGTDFVNCMFSEGVVDELAKLCRIETDRVRNE